MKNKRQKESAAIDRQRRKARRRLRRQDFAQSLCFLSPSLLGVGVFFIIPFGVVVYYSLIDSLGNQFRKLGRKKRREARAGQEPIFPDIN